MASLSGKINLEVELKSSADKFWEGITKSTELFPKVFPEQYKGIELVQGDGKGVGSIRKINFDKGVPIITTVVERIDSIDEGSKSVSYSTIDGDLLTLYKKFNAMLEVVPRGDGCTAKWNVLYEKANEEVPEPNITIQLAKKTFEDFDAYLLKN